MTDVASFCFSMYSVVFTFQFRPLDCMIFFYTILIVITYWFAIFNIVLNHVKHNVENVAQCECTMLFYNTRTFTLFLYCKRKYFLLLVFGGFTYFKGERISRITHLLGNPTNHLVF